MVKCIFLFKTYLIVYCLLRGLHYLISQNCQHAAEKVISALYSKLSEKLKNSFEIFKSSDWGSSSLPTKFLDVTVICFALKLHILITMLVHWYTMGICLKTPVPVVTFWSRYVFSFVCLWCSNKVTSIIFWATSIFIPKCIET